MEPLTETDHLLCETGQKSQTNQECDREPQDHNILLEKNKTEVLQEKDKCILTELEDRERSLEERLTEVMKELETKSKEQMKIQKDYVKLWLKYEEALSYLADAKYQEKKAKEVNAELRHNNSVLIEQRAALHSSAKYMRKLLYNRHNLCIKKAKCTLQNENHELKNQVGTWQTKVEDLEEQLKTCRTSEKELMEQRQSQSDYYSLWVKYKEAVFQLADANDREREALENNAILRNSNSVLMDQQKVLQNSVDHLRDLFAQERKMHVNSAKSTLQNKNNAMRKQVQILQTTVNMLEEQLKTHTTGEEKPMEQMQSQKDFFTLWVKYEEAVSHLADAEDQEMTALEDNAELEHNNSILIEQQKALQSSLDYLQELFAQQRKTRAKLLKSTLQIANNALRKQVQILQIKVNMLEEQLKIGETGEEEPMEQGQSQNNYYTLWVKYEEALSHLADARNEERKALEDSVELKHNNSLLNEQLEASKGVLHQLLKLFHDFRSTGIKITQPMLQNENISLKMQARILQTKIENLKEHLEIRRRGEEEMRYCLLNFRNLLAKETDLKTPTC
ncbi:myosin-9-like isoform X1 [Silurus meridionalis]|uniref:Uncharacterized protein n=1 Tax=Silurus meridionalis TaxID=175797 RepID=A0A8T0BPW9_SILME|nr:myosin-9-like isoform X1 [Silurus meridionalis]KAF7709129.1 hypothetical protein HF521_015979 [Silurus meridionalis]